MRVTRFSDVCGTLDELRKMFEKGSLDRGEIETAINLVDDAIYMIGRMLTRLQEYEDFKEELRSILNTMDQIEIVEETKPRKVTDKLRSLISKGFSEKKDLERSVELAEEIRQIANKLERALRTYKGKFLDVVELYGRVKGVRDWSKDEKEKIGTALPILIPINEILENVKEWLPPEPHRSKIIDFVKAGRAYIQPKRRREPPVVQFEDGGTIPLHKIRYSERAGYQEGMFYPEDRPPKTLKEPPCKSKEK